MGICYRVHLSFPSRAGRVGGYLERKNLLALFFFLAAFHSYLSYRKKAAGLGKLFYVFSVATFVLSLLSKSVVVILPLVLFLYDHCYLKKDERKRWLLDKIPFGITAAT